MKTKRRLFFLTSLLLLALLSTAALAAEPEGEPETADVSAYVLQEGGFLPEPGERDRKYLSSGSVYEDARATFYNGVSSRAERIDFSSFRIGKEDFSRLYAYWLNEFPEFFYVSSGYTYYSSGAVITWVLPNYKSQYTRADSVAFQNACSRIQSMIDPSWHAIERLLFLHDYLVTHCEYDTSYVRNDAYQALVTGLSACHGYSLAFRKMCQLAGVPCTYVSSRDLDHAWNYVVINNKNYYVDCTWDDPVGQWYEGYCGHGNFLVSRDSLARNHNTTDWTDGYNNVYSTLASGSDMDGVWWTNVITAVPIINHICAYTLQDEPDWFFIMDLRDYSYTAVRLPGSAVWNVLNSSSHYTQNFCSFTARNDHFYFTMPTGIWTMELGGEPFKVYELTASERAQGYLYGVVNVDGTLYYNVGAKPAGVSFRRGVYSGNPGEGLAISAVYFPDDTYRNYLASVIDTNHNGFLTWAEVEQVTEIDVSGMGIQRLNGLNIFPNLRVLDCRDNKISALDLSQNPQLVGLYCGGNQLTALDLSKNTALTTLQCQSNKLKSLDISRNKALKTLYCQKNSLSRLEIGKAPALAALVRNTARSAKSYGFAYKGQEGELRCPADLKLSIDGLPVLALGKDYVGLVELEGTWWYVNHGEIDTTYTGLAQNENGWWYIQKGKINFDYTGLATNENGTFYVYKGQFADWRTGCEWVNGEYCEFYKGQLTTWKKDATVVDPNGDGHWVSMRYGKVDMTYTGIAENENGFWYVKNGVLDLTFTGLVTNDYGTWFIYLGQLANWRDGCDWVNGEYCEFYKGQLTTWKKDATLVDPHGDDNWVSMRYGRIDMGYTGLADNQYGWWYVKNGRLSRDLTDLVTNDYGTWYVYKGQLVTWKDGIQYVEKRHNSYYIYKGQLADWYTGDVTENGVVYHVSAGLVTGAN